MVKSKQQRCELENTGGWLEITSDDTLKNEAKEQTMKVAVIVGCLKDPLWRNI